MKHVISLLLSFLFVTGPTFALTIKATLKGATSTTDVEKNPNLKPTNITVTDPNESTKKKSATVNFAGYPGKATLDALFGGRDKWSKAATITFVCADGYAPTLETKYFLTEDFYFATRRKDQTSFTIQNNAKDGKTAELAPFYIVWPSKSMSADDKRHYWPYQVVEVKID